MDLASMIIAAANSLTGVMWVLLWSLGGLVGFVYAGMVLRRMQLASVEPGRRPISAGGTVMVLIIGALLFNLSGTIGTVWTTFSEGQANYGAISWSGAEQFGKFKEAVNAVLTLASLAGGFFCFKGLLLLKKASIDGESSNGADDLIWRALTHLIAGAGLVHVDKMIDAFQETFKLYW
ncbi:conjugal transfer protein TraQ [Pseudomonas savastanoi]|uniref:conjugal transfer protein TraQ n=1 Tax=Pseudomonas savastanoi TaxID=29438 RepID=UPI000EFEF234|nr:conjugal transfer protein TraQ [Pseudomonas savastanoi]